MSEKSGEDLNSYSDLENRYEPNQELKWLADFIVNVVVLCKHDLKIENPEIVAETVEAMWKTLDYHNIQDEVENGGAAIHGRYTFLKSELESMFFAQRLTHKQVRIIVDYAHRTLFNHMHLYLACLSSKQPRTAKPMKIMPCKPQMAPSGGLDGEGVTEIPEDDNGEAEMGELDNEMEGDMEAEGEPEGQDQMEQEEEEDEPDVQIDPEDPLYGLE